MTTLYFLSLSLVILIVINLSSFTLSRCGFTNESSPRAIIRSTVTINDRTEPLIISSCSLDEQCDRLYFFLERLYFQFLAVNPKDRRVIIVESVFTPSKFRKSLARVLFKRFSIPSLTFVPSHLVSLITLAIKTCLVVDIGYSECAVIPVIEGITVLEGAQFASLGAQAIHKRIIQDLQATGCKIIDQSLDESNEKPVAQLDTLTLEDIKIRCCFVAPFERRCLLTENALKSDTIVEGSPLPVKYPIDGSKSLVIQGIVRECAFEVLFEDNGHDPSLPKTILDALLLCPLDWRRQLANNILLIGGSVMAPGFKHRLNEELKCLLSTDAYRGKLFINSFAFHSPPCKENYTAWLGGAIFGSTEAVNSRQITRDEYEKKGDLLLKDWCD